MLRTALLWGNTINLDSDYSKYIETVSDPWVIEGFAVENSKVKPGKAWVKVTRSNGESLFVLVQNTQDIPVSLNGDVFIGIEVAQNAIDNGLMNNEEGTGIASIKVWPQKPNQNYLLLAVLQGGRLSDKRMLIPKLQSLSQRTSTLEAKVQQTEGKVEKLAEAGVPDHLEEYRTVGEKYTIWDVLALQRSANFEDCTNLQTLGSSNSDKEIHIQGISSGKLSNTIELSLSKIGNPSNLVVEIRKWIKEDIREDEAYWYGWDVIASATIPSSQIKDKKNKISVKFDRSFGWTENELLSVVVYQQWGINSSNYYYIWCDSTQRSECFRYIVINEWGGKNIQKNVAFLSSDAFKKLALVKKDIVQVFNFSGNQDKLIDDPDSEGAYLGDGSAYKVVKIKQNKNIWRLFSTKTLLTVSIDYDLEIHWYVRGYGVELKFNSLILNNDTPSDEYQRKLRDGDTLHNFELNRRWNDSDTITWKWIQTVYKSYDYTTTGKFWFAVIRGNIKSGSKVKYNLKYNLMVKGSQFSRYTWKNYYPRELKWIGEKAPCTIFGRHIDGGWGSQ